MKHFCTKCKKEIHIWHEKYHAEADINPIGLLTWLKIYFLGRPKAWIRSNFYHLDCSHIVNLPVITKAFVGFGILAVFFLLIAISFLVSQQSAVIPISGVGTFVLYWKDGAYVYGGSVAVCLFFMWHIYEDTN